jgi:hypothetical protein
MKNKILWVAAAALALASCSNDDVVSVPKADNSSDLIKFRTSVANSRAVQVTTKNLSEFYVGALQIDGTQNNAPAWGGFQKFTLNDGVFYPDNEVVWGSIGLNFFATNINFYEQNPKNTHTLGLPSSTAAPQPTVFYKISGKVAEQQDIIYATNKGTRSDFSNVSSIPLDFRHALSQIKIYAKKTINDYKIRVKGYKIYKAGFNQGTFILPEPINIGGAYADENAVSPIGTWSFESSDKNTATTIVSGFYGGLTVTANSQSDKSGNYVDLSTRAAEIKGCKTGETDEGYAMALPINNEGTAENDLGYITGWHLGAGGNPNNDGTYIALLVQIDDVNDKPVFPAKNATTGKRIAYRGLPLYYGYVICPVTIKWSAGTSYTYTLNFQDGLGISDPNQPQTVDPDTYDPSTDDGTGEVDPGDEDPITPGTNVLDGTISFTLDVNSWDESAGSTTNNM